MGLVSRLRRILNKNSSDLENYLDNTISEENFRDGERNRLKRKYGENKLRSSVQKKINDKDGDIESLFKELKEIGGEDSFELAVNFLQSEDEEIQLEAAKILGQFKEFEPRDEITQVLKSSQDLRMAMIKNSFNASDTFKEFVWQLADNSDDKLTKITCYLRTLDFIGEEQESEAYRNLLDLLETDVDLEILEEMIETLEKEARFNDKIEIQDLDEKLINLIEERPEIAEKAKDSLALIGSRKAIEYFKDKDEELYLEAKGEKTEDFVFDSSEMSILDTGIGWTGVSGKIDAKLGDHIISNEKGKFELTDTAKAWKEAIIESEEKGRSSSYGLCCTCGDRGCAGLMIEIRSFDDTYSVRLGSHKSSVYIAEIEKEKLIEPLTNFMEEIVDFLKKEGKKTRITPDELEEDINNLEKLIDR